MFGGSCAERDEIIIHGRKKKLSQLEAEIIKAQDAFYDAFNKVFVHTATRDEARRVLDQYPGRPGGDPGPPASMVVSGKMRAYHKYVHDLVHQNPQLRETLGRYYALTQHYLAVRKEKFRGKWFVWD